VKAPTVAIGGAIAALILGGLVAAMCTPACGGTLGGDVKTAENDVLALAPEVAADATCVIEALEADPNITSPVNDIALAGGVYGCFRLPDGGATITEDQAVALAAKHRATAKARVLARRALGDAGTTASR
jgi:hypothetical protein